MTSGGKKDLLSMTDLSIEELAGIIDSTGDIKREPGKYKTLLDEKTVLMIFEKPSTRTRISFECACLQLGGHAINIARNASQIDRGETLSDSAKVLERYVDAIVGRVNSHSTLTELASNARIPVINALSDLEHPCQTIADLYTIRELSGGLEGVNITYVGDGNNVCNSLLLGCAMMGMNIRIATPDEYKPDGRVCERAGETAKKTGATIGFYTDPIDAVKGADYVYTDVWVSMGEEDRIKEKVRAFEGFQLNAALMENAPGARVMHCLPAHRGTEITSEVLDSPASIVWDQAENRLHSQKAVLLKLLLKADE